MIHNFIFRFLRLSGLPYISRELLQKKKISILLFHDINPRDADCCFKYLSKHYNIIGLNDFLAACYQKINLPNKSLIITFDDGYVGNYDLLPIIKSYNIPITIFLCAGIVDTHKHFWYKEVNSKDKIDHLKKIPNYQRLRFLLKTGFQQDLEFEEAQSLSKKHIDQMKNFVNFQSHSLYHPILPKCNIEITKQEINESKNKLEKDYGLKINAFSYPNGEYSDRDIELVKNAGYECAITVDFGFNTINSDLYRLKRLSVNDPWNINELIVKASGVWGFLNKILRRGKSIGWSNIIEQ